MKNYAEIKKQAEDKIANENALIDKYLALPNRPKIKVMLRVIETSEPKEADVDDLEDWKIWRAKQ